MTLGTITSNITLGNIYAMCRGLDIVMLSVVMLNLIMLSVIMLSVVAPSEAGSLNKS